MFGHVPLTRSAASGDGPDEFDVAQGRPSGDAGYRPPRPARVRSSPAGMARPARTRRRQHTAEADTGGDQAIDSASAISGFVRAVRCSAGTPAARPSLVARPGLRQEQSQRHRHRHLAARQRQRHQGLAIGRLAQCRRILRSDTDRVRALLRHRRVVDDQDRIAAADQLVSLDEKFCLQRSLLPDASSNKMVQLIIVDPAQDALPLAERSCDHPVRSAPPRKVDTFAAVTCDPSAPGTARASAQARLPNPTLFPPWPALQMPTTHELLKN